MKYIKLTLIGSILACFAAQYTHAQIAENALRFGEIGSFGTARIQGLGGAGYSLGGDVSAAAINPAGLGFFNRSTVVFTPTFMYTGTNANFLGQSSKLADTHVGISNFGIVFNNTREGIRPSNWRGGSFGITYNRISRRNLDYTFGPAENGFSLIDEFAGQASGFSADELNNYAADESFIAYPEAAYYNYLINPVDPNNTSGTEYVGSIPEGTLADQQGTLDETSTVSQWNFSYGGNFKDKLYLGASVGFKSFSYQRTNTFQENYLYPQDYVDFIDAGGYFFPVPDGDISVDYVNANILNERQSISGTGINANLGVIYRPINEITVGLSYQTPTVYSVSEDYQYTLASNVSGIIDPNSSAGEEPFDLVIDGNESGVIDGSPVITQYRLTTPSKLGAGLTYFFQKYGFLTADVEYVNYQSSQFNSGEFETGYLNDEVNRFFRSAINYKVGGEFRYDIFRIRAGYAMYGTGTQYPGDNLDRDRRVLSAGIGINTAKFFADLAITNTSFESDYRPYTYASYFPLDQTTLKNSITQASLSIGFNF